MAVEKQFYEVLHEPPNRMLIAGKRDRKAGERIELTEAEAQFLVLDGIVKKVEAPKPEGKTEKAAPKTRGD